MDVPFTTEQFIEVIAQYNETYFPVQVVFYLPAIWALVMLIRNHPKASQLTNYVLGIYWVWMGVAYHWIKFTAINPMAWAFGGLFVLQGILFLVAANKKEMAEYRLRGGWQGGLAWIFILYALVVYPVLGYILGMRYPEMIIIGLPCPTTIFTFGILLWSTRTFRKGLAIIPFLWAIIGTSAAFKFGIWQDLGLGVAGISGAFILWFRKSKTPPAVNEDRSSTMA